jgi:hypothetical protein
MKLLIAPCDYKAATYAVKNWHYSKTMPIGRLVTLGVWEDDVFVGSVIYGRGASSSLGSFLSLDQSQCCELVRVALKSGHKTKTSKVLAIALKVFSKLNPGIKAVISFADPEQKHKGCIYQATNWFFVGLTEIDKQYYLGGKWIHSRNVNSGPFGRSVAYTKNQIDNAPKRKTLPKIKYVYCFDADTKVKASALSHPYSAIDKAFPKGYFSARVDGASSSTPADQAGDGGASPTPTLSGTP